jgi:hypothetical protein
MGANSTRVPHILVTNVAAGNTGTTVATAVDNDMLVVNRANTVLTAGATITSAFENDVIRIALGTSATAGVIKWSSPIHVKGIRKVTTLAYEAPVPHRVVISAASTGTITTGKVYAIKINFHDTNDLMNSGKDGAQYFTYTATATDTTAALVYAGLAAVINGVNANIKQVTATVVGSTLQIDGDAVADNALGFPQFRYFDVSLRKGFTYTAATSITVTPGKPGRGIPAQVKQVELGDKYNFNRTQFPVDVDTRRAVSTGTYNCVVIEHGTPHLSVHHSTYVAPETTVLYFQGATLADGVINGSAFTSAKQKAIMDILEPLIEGVGVYVK